MPTWFFDRIEHSSDMTTISPRYHYSMVILEQFVAVWAHLHFNQYPCSNCETKKGLYLSRFRNIFSAVCWFLSHQMSQVFYPFCHWGIWMKIKSGSQIHDFFGLRKLPFLFLCLAFVLTGLKTSKSFKPF